MTYILKHTLLGAACASLLIAVSGAAQAMSVSGQGTWESTLQGRDLDGNAATFEAYYDTTLDITWLANANGTGMNWATANAWAAALDVNGITGWRLPTVTPINGSAFQTNGTTNATSDIGHATSAGWVDGSGTPVSEMGHMFYVTLGNLGFCPPDGGDGDPETCDGGGPSGWGLSNTGPFSNIQIIPYWSGTELDDSFAWDFFFNDGAQFIDGKDTILLAWAVRSGDVSAVPVPAAVWLFGSGLLGLIGVSGKRRRS